VNFGLVYIDGGHNDDNPPTVVDPLSLILCNKVRMVSARIGQIPNEPITFLKDWKNKKRSEDAIIAYTWSHFLNDTTHPYWLLRMPMTKAVVRAMDTIQDFTGKLPIPKIQFFGVAGASKRGWTTWTTGIVDKRVKIIVPLVIPVLNMIPTINTMFRVYGKWSFALSDYVEEGVIRFLNKPEFKQMAAIEDPYSYNDRFNALPKYIIGACGDEFFLPDSTRYFYPQLNGPKYLRLVPNAEHSLAPQDIDVAIAIGTYFHMHIMNRPIPQYEYTLTRSNSTGAKITVKTNEKPTSVYMWYASTLSVKDRDFRLFTCRSPDCFNPVIWYYTELHDQGNFTFVATMDAPRSGWTGFLVELIYVQSYNPVFPEATLKFTSEVNVVPDILPYPPCKAPDC